MCIVELYWFLQNLKLMSLSIAELIWTNFIIQFVMKLVLVGLTMCNFIVALVDNKFHAKLFSIP